MIIPFHLGSILTVVTDDCHANSIFVIHVTDDVIHRKQATFSIRVNDVASTFCSRLNFLQVTT